MPDIYIEQLFQPQGSADALTIDQVLKYSPILIVGEAGHGKSTLTRKLRNEHDALVINARDISHPETFLSSIGSPSLLVIDSLDECADAEQQETIQRNISQWAQQHPDTQLIVTSRPNTPLGMITNTNSLPGFSRFLLPLWSNKQIEAYVEQELTNRGYNNIMLLDIKSGFAANIKKIDLQNIDLESPDLDIKLKFMADLHGSKTVIERFFRTPALLPNALRGYIWKLKIPDDPIELAKIGIQVSSQDCIRFIDKFAEQAGDDSLPCIFGGIVGEAERASKIFSLLAWDLQKRRAEKTGQDRFSYTLPELAEAIDQILIEHEICSESRLADFKEKSYENYPSFGYFVCDFFAKHSGIMMTHSENRIGFVFNLYQEILSSLVLTDLLQVPRMKSTVLESIHQTLRHESWRETWNFALGTLRKKGFSEEDMAYYLERVQPKPDQQPEASFFQSFCKPSQNQPVRQDLAL